MKKLLLIFSLSIILFGCDNTNPKIVNKESETTEELKILANKDTSTYKIVLLNDKLYAINTKTQLVEYKIRNQSSYSDFATIVILLFLIIIFILIALI